jgi:hypothetical protein
MVVQVLSSAVLLIVFITCHCKIHDFTAENTCSLYLGWANYEDGGKTLFAGETFRQGDTMDVSPALLLRNGLTSALSSSSIQNYLFGSGNDDYTFFLFGTGAVTNYGRNDDTVHVDHLWNSSLPAIETPPEYPNSVYFYDYFQAKKLILTGEEIQYAWGTPTPASTPLSTAGEKRCTICLSTIDVRASTIPNAGYGVFSRRFFKKDELISISPVLILPYEDEDIREDIEHEMLLNYCYYEKEPSLLLLPLNTPALMNHYRSFRNNSNAPQNEPNVRLNWFDWYDYFNSTDGDHCSFPSVNSPRRVKDLLNLSPEEIIQEQEKHGQSMIDIGYYAIRDIAEDEELVIDYGSDWEAYYRSRTKDGIKDVRYPIQLPQGFLPKQWKLENRSVPEQEEELDDFHCDGLFIAPSTIPNAGRGIFAGKKYRKGSDVEIIPSVFVNTPICDKTQLHNYVFGSNHANYSMMQFGVGPLFNHNNNKTVYHYWNMAEIDAVAVMNDTSNLQALHDVVYRAESRLKRNQELFGFYGNEWFSSHGFSDSNLEKSDKKDEIATETTKEDSTGSGDSWKSKRICLSTIDIRPSSLPNAGNGIFTKKAFKKDELITVSPVLLLPYDEDETIQELENEMLINYCYYERNLSVLVLPVNIPVLLNHYRPMHNTSEAFVSIAATGSLSVSSVPTSSEGANVRVEWFDWSTFTSDGTKQSSNLQSSTSSLQDILSIPVSDLLSSPYGKLDIAFYATRDLAVDEELFLDYGKEWEDAFTSYLLSENKPVRPFRHWIQRPSSLTFPANWFV